MASRANGKIIFVYHEIIFVTVHVILISDFVMDLKYLQTKLHGRFITACELLC